MKTIILKQYGVGHYADSNLTVIDGDLYIEVDGMTAKNGNYHAIAQLDGDEKQYFRISDGMVTIPKDKLHAGTLILSVHLYVNGRKLKEWECEPLYLQEVHNGLNGYPVIAKLSDHITECGETIAKLARRAEEEREANKETREELKCLKNAITGLVRLVCGIANSSPYADDLDEKETLENLGLIEKKGEEEK